MSQILSLCVTEDKREKYEKAIRHIQSQNVLCDDNSADKEAVKTLLNLSRMIVTEYDRKDAQ